MINPTDRAGKKQHYSSENQVLWLQLQRNQMKLSSRSTFIVAENSGHYVQRDEPEIVVQVIQNLIGEERSCISID
ncbi:hypothetical protein NNL21_03040 [Paenibacillus mendelii]|nr:hypothetical protein [Paenibacillus mendelii]